MFFELYLEWMRCAEAEIHTFGNCFQAARKPLTKSLTMCMSKALPTSKERPSKAPCTAKQAPRSKIVPLQVAKPVMARTQEFIDEEGWEDEENENIEEEADGQDDDGITIGSTSTRSADTSSRSRSRRNSRHRSPGYGDETDGTYIDSDEEADEQSSDDEALDIGDSDMEQDEDDVEIVGGAASDGETSDSDIELVPTQSTAPAHKVKAESTRKAKGKSKSGEVDSIRQHYTEHIFFALQEIVTEVGLASERGGIVWR